MNWKFDWADLAFKHHDVHELYSGKNHAELYMYTLLPVLRRLSDTNIVNISTFNPLNSIRRGQMNLKEFVILFY